MGDFYKRVINRFLSLLDQELLVRDKIPVEEVKLLLLQSFMEADENKPTSPPDAKISP